MGENLQRRVTQCASLKVPDEEVQLNGGETMQSLPRIPQGSGQPLAQFSWWESSSTTATSSSADSADLAFSTGTGPVGGHLREDQSEFVQSKEAPRLEDQNKFTPIATPNCEVLPARAKHKKIARICPYLSSSCICFHIIKMSTEKRRTHWVLATPRLDIRFYLLYGQIAI